MFYNNQSTTSAESILLFILFDLVYSGIEIKMKLNNGGTYVKNKPNCKN